MDMTHLQLIGAIIGAAMAAGWPAFQASQRSRRLEEQVSPNGDPDTRTIRQLIVGIQAQLVELMHASNRMADELAEHDKRTKGIHGKLTEVEEKLNRHLEWDNDPG